MAEDKELQAEIGKHLMQPENYGKIEDADCVGVGIDHATKSYVIIYIKRDEESILDVKFGTNGNQDTTTLGSIFTEMIKGDSIESALETTANLEKDLQESYAAIPAPKVDTSKPEGEQVEHISTEHQDSANMVLTAFRAAMRHYDRKLGGIDEEQFEMSIVKTCPYSTKECNLVAKDKKKS
ncbi:iron-sulfur cluster assembly scaffold protein [Sulfurimonas sp.]|uniref:iron-sulfur cluster assembly scaffold protein n=1 Tax=Sulfurimonas sp. TaxID=2022749 RepID=UPI0019E49DBD|nr:iron-sulfur cluster assembly scaffold protein [Sulfurimonas sp.]MBE0513984.1 iron-sulfur cluster assembly scaffold protein [Sulfurimonas sp.]